MSHSSNLTAVYVEPNSGLQVSGDDLDDMYHCFITSEDADIRNALVVALPGSHFNGFSCYKEEYADIHVLVCFATLAMGGNLAVEIAQHSHASLLRGAGCLRADEVVSYNQPIPRGPTYELLAVDDRIIVQEVEFEKYYKIPEPSRRDVQILS